MTNEIIGRPNIAPNGQRMNFGQPFSTIKEPVLPPQPENYQETANEAVRICQQITGIKDTTLIKRHIRHHVANGALYDWWKQPRFNGNAAEYLAYMREDAIVWACQLAAEARRIKWPDAVAMAGDCPLPDDAENIQRDIAAWVETLDYIIASGELTPGAPPETYEAMRAEHRAKLERKYAEQKEKAEVKIKDEKGKPNAALDAAKKTAALKGQIEPAIAKLNAALAEAEADFNDTPAEGTDVKTGEIVPVEPDDGLYQPGQKSAETVKREAIIAHYCTLYGVEPQYTKDIGRGLNVVYDDDPWFMTADKLTLDENIAHLLKFHTEHPPKAPKEAATKPSEPPAKVDEPQSKPPVETKPVGGDKTPPVKDTTNKPLVLVSYLAKMTTLTGVPVGEINMRLDAKHDLGAYKPIELAGGKIGTDLAQWAVRNRLDEVFGPHGIGWKLEPHSVLGSITHEEKTMPNGNLKHIVTLIGYVFKYRVVIGDEVEWIELSPMSDSDGNTDKGYAFRGAQTSLLKQVLRSMGGINHLYQNKDLARWASDEYAKRKQRKAG